jgi:hypothetical protein
MPVTVSYTTQRIYVNSGELFEPGGAVHVWSSGVSREMWERAKAFASPVNSKARRPRPRTGELERSIKREVFADAGNIVNFSVWAESPHAKYVHEGTAYKGRRYIYTTRGYANKATVDAWIKGGFFEMGKGEHGWVMPLPGWSWTNRDPGGFPMQYYMKVRGQFPNPFLLNAYRMTQRRHPGLPARNWGLD